MSKVLIRKMAEDNNLHLLAGEKGLDNVVSMDMITRPGVELAGFFQFFDSKRIVLIGSKEGTFFNTLTEEQQKERLDYMFRQSPPAFVFSVNLAVPDLFIAMSNKYNIPLLKADLRTTPLSSKLYGYLQERLTERLNVHGVLLDINGMGTLIMGKSGIGKSEIALELIKRGHQLISDDRVEVYQKEVGVIVGQPPKILEKYMEIRGIGVVDVVRMFGAGAFRESKKIRLVVELEKWEDGRFYDRLGLESQTIKYFDTEITKIILPVSPGRNVATLIEAAAMNEKLKFMGYNAAERFTQAVHELITKGGNE